MLRRFEPNGDGYGAMGTLVVWDLDSPPASFRRLGRRPSRDAKRKEKRNLITLENVYIVQGLIRSNIEKK